MPKKQRSTKLCPLSIMAAPSLPPFTSCSCLFVQGHRYCDPYPRLQFPMLKPISCETGLHGSVGAPVG